MDTLASFAAAVEGTDIVRALKFSQLGYALANTAHVLGFTLLVGAILPMDLRLIGFWRTVDQGALTRVLTPIAAVGLVIAVLAGVALFSVRAGHYLNASIFYWKLGLIAAGAALALILHLRAGLWLQLVTRRQAAFHGAASLCCWLGALVAGRMIAYFPNFPN